MNGRFRPLVWAGPTTPTEQRRPRSTFKASWQSTLDLLERELEYLDATDVVIEADFAERDIRLDGWPRGNARQPVHPGVRVAFGSKHGPLVYATDSCDFWQHNVRSIGLGLEALRAVDRYGVTRRGEQYQGYRAIGAGVATPMPGVMDHDQAREVLREACRSNGFVMLPSVDETLVRKARRATHPDQGGDAEAFHRVQAAATVLGVD